MSLNQTSSTQDAKESPGRYRVIVQGHLHPHWQKRFTPMKIIHQPDGTTCLEGYIEDQAALYGLIIKLRDMGLTLLAVMKI